MGMQTGGFLNEIPGPNSCAVSRIECSRGLRASGPAGTLLPMNNPTVKKLQKLLNDLVAERDSHRRAIQEIDAVLAQTGVIPRAVSSKAGPSGPRRRKQGRRKAGTSKKAGKKAAARPAAKKGRKARGRAKGVKKALEAALSATPQSPRDLAAKVSGKLGRKVSVAAQLRLLQREGKAKTVGRAQWTTA